MREHGLREVYVDARRAGALVDRLGPPSTPALAEYLDDAGVTLEPGWRAEVNLAAVDWIGRRRRAARAADSCSLIDYGYEAAELYSAAPRARARWRRSIAIWSTPPAADGPAAPAWLADPGGRDLTSHVDLTSIRRAAERAGPRDGRPSTDQTRFLLDILERRHAGRAELSAPDGCADRLALKTLLMPGGLGSTHKVMVFAKR